jgi:xanthine dehydrogenase YagS FAD-binding subunit
MLPNFSLVRAHSVEEAIEHLGSKETRIHAGGTDLLGCLRDQVFGASKLVSLSGIASMRGMAETADRGLRIGALSTITELAESTIVRERYTALARAASEVASPQLRNQGTIGGNLCQKPRCWYYRGEFPCRRKGGQTCFALLGENAFHAIFGDAACIVVHPSDPAPALIALGATVEIQGPEGTRRIEVENLHVRPEVDPTRETVLAQDELITAVLLPAPAKGLRSSYRKVRARRSWDFALVGLALAVVMDGERVAQARAVLSGVAPVPWRSAGLENAILGKNLDAATIRQAARAAVADARPRAHNGYKVGLVEGVVTEELNAIKRA